MRHTPSVPVLPSLTGIRAPAALLVFLFHAQWENHYIGGGTGDTISDIIDRGGTWGLGLFFALSGFVLTWTASANDTVVGFWRRRVVKVFPNHLVTYALAVVILLSSSQAIPLDHWLPNLFLVQTWVPDVARVVSLNGVSWSLSAELFFYLSFPFLLMTVNRIRDERLWLSTGVVAALIVGATFFSYYVLSDQPRLIGFGGDDYSYNQIWFIWFFPPVRGLEFVLGVLLAKLVLAGRWRPIGLPAAVGLSFAGYLVSTFAVPYLFGVSGVATLWTAPLLAELALADVEKKRSWVRHPVLVWFGNLSFAFYMIHWLVIGRVTHWARPDPSRPVVDGLGLILLTFVVSLFLAWLMHNFIEMPAVRRFSGTRPRSVTVRAYPHVTVPAPSTSIPSTAVPNTAVPNTTVPNAPIPNATAESTGVA
ncbi:acyltransferase 3 [Parafrankia sp. EAN1pec]|uniref:acyltransferase family protein n=1 Tax=Parafrankia sp. (strain EAN1pec) TaxID=298653 RepID=UPI00005447EB|nr:acyltransferase 3 [Frankia sp. EAN1pec]